MLGKFKDAASSAAGDAASNAAGDALGEMGAPDIVNDAVSGAVGDAVGEAAGNAMEESKGAILTGEMDPEALATGMRDTMKFSISQPGKQATTILSSHLDTLPSGSMIIVLDNSMTSLSIAEPVTGKIKVNLKDPFKAKALTLGIRGIQRSSFKPDVPGDQFGSTAKA